MPSFMKFQVQMFMSTFKISSCTSLKLCRFCTWEKLQKKLPLGETPSFLMLKAVQLRKKICDSVIKQISSKSDFPVPWERKAQIPLKYNGIEYLNSSKIHWSLSAHIQLKSNEIWVPKPLNMVEKNLPLLFHMIMRAGVTSKTYGITLQLAQQKLNLIQ